MKKAPKKYQNGGKTETDKVFEQLSAQQAIKDKALRESKIKSEIASGVRNPSGEIKIPRNQWSPQLLETAIGTSKGLKGVTKGAELTPSASSIVTSATGGTSTGNWSTDPNYRLISGTGTQGQNVYEGSGTTKDPSTGLMYKQRWIEGPNKEGSTSLYLLPHAVQEQKQTASIPVKTTPTLTQTADETDAEALMKLQQKKKGGLVSKLKMGGKVKGYDDGGTTDNSKEIAAAVSAGLPYVAEGANLAILNKNNVDEYGRIDTGSKAGDYAAGIGSESLTGAAKGAQVGMAAGPYGALVGAGAGAILGGVKGGIETKRDRASIEDDKRAEEAAKRQLEMDRQREVFNRSLNKELMGRKTGYGYKKGGLIQKCAVGGEVDGDKYGYTVNDNSLSNEKKTIFGGVKYTDKGLGGGGVGISAPTAMFAKGGYVKGPGTGTSDSVKAKIEPGSFIVPAKNAPVAEKIHKMMEGGKMMSEDEMESHHEAMKKKMAPKKKVASLNEEDGEEVRLSNGEYKFTPEQRKEIISELGEDVLEMLAPEADEYSEEKKNGGLTSMKAKEILKDGNVHGKALTDKQMRYMGWIAGGGKPGMYNGGKVDGYYDGGKTKKKTSDPFAGTGVDDKKKGVYSATDSDIESKQSSQGSSDKLGSGKKRSAPKRSNRNPLSPSVYVPTESDMSMVAPKEEETQAQKLKRELEASDAAQLSASASQYEKSNPYTAPSGNKSGLSAQQLTQLGGDLLQTASAGANFMLPRRQVRMGTEFLAKSGARPVDQISPEFQDAYNKAQQEAKYGFSPEEQALIKNQNLNALKQQREAARFYGLGYAGERQAINESFGRGLSAAVANKERMLQKQMEANQLGLQKADMSRRLFNDQMNAWQQNQQSGAELVNAGLTNQINAKRYADVLMNLQKNKAVESSWLNNLNLGQ